MSSTSRVSRKFLFAFCLFSFVLATAPPLYSEEPSDKQSGGQMMEESSSMYGQLVAHVEDALHAARGNDLNKAVKHAEMAIKASYAVQKDFDTMKVEKEVQHDFAEGMKLLEDAINKSNKGTAKLFEASLTDILIRLKDKVDGGAGDDTCQGDGCPMLSSGCCSSPGMTKCNRINPARKCTNAGSPCNACYCL